MVFYEEPYFIVAVIGIISAIIIGLIKIQQDKIRSHKTEYEIHIKDLVNTIYNKVTRNGGDLSNPNFFGSIGESKEIQEHFFMQREKSNLYDVFSKIKEGMVTRGMRDKIPELNKQLSDEFIKLHEKINHDVDPDFGVCSQCNNKKSKIPFLNRRKLKKIKI